MSYIYSNEQDIKIANLKVEAYELSQQVRDFEALREQYLKIQQKIKCLKQESEFNYKNLSNIDEQQSNISYQFKDQFQKNLDQQNYLYSQGEDFEVDLVGIKKHAEEKMRNLKNQKNKIQRQSDIYRKLQLDINDEKFELQNMQETYGEFNLRKEELQEIMKQNQQIVENLKDNHNLIKRTDFEQVKQSFEQTKKQELDLLVEDRMIDNQISENNQQLQNLKILLEKQVSVNSQKNDFIEESKKCKQNYEDQIVNVLNPQTLQLENQIENQEKLLQSLNSEINGLTSFRQKHLQDIYEEEQKQFVIQKMILEQQRKEIELMAIQRNLKNQQETMHKNDMIVKKSISRRQSDFSEINILNKQNIHFANQNLVQSGLKSNYENGNLRTSGFISGVSRGIETLGAIDGNIQSPFIVQPSIFDHDVKNQNKQTAQFEQYMNNQQNSIEQAKLNLRNSKENQLYYKYENLDNELRQNQRISNTENQQKRLSIDRSHKAPLSNQSFRSDLQNRTIEMDLLLKKLQSKK